MTILPRWTPEQLDAIRDNAGLTDKDLAEQVNRLGPHRSIQAVKNRRQYSDMTRAPTAWSDPQCVGRLATLYGQGLSASQIARALNEEFKAELSRNAVIGKIHRLGILKPERASYALALSHAPDRAKARKPVRQFAGFQHGAGCAMEGEAKPAKPVRMVGPTPDSLNIPMWDARFKAGCCKYATGEDEFGHVFCAVPVVPGAPYCGAHLAACWQVGTAQENPTFRNRSAKAFGDASSVPQNSGGETVLPVDMAMDEEKQKGRYRARRFGTFEDAA